MDFLKTAIPIFGRPENYSEMLHKLAGFVFWECVIGLYILNKNAQFSNWLENSYLNFIPEKSLPDELSFISSGVIVISILVSFIFYFFQMHDVLQRPFKIRERFDRDKIFLPLSKLVGKSPQSDKIARFEQARSSFMQKIFYKYASSTRSDTVVDQHNVIQALWLWSMFWALEEAILIFLIFAGVFLVFDLPFYAALYGILCLIFLIGMSLMWPRLSNAAMAEIEQIAENAISKAEVRKAISAL